MNAPIISELSSIAQALVAPSKGILAADESTGTIAKRLHTIEVECTEENRRTYREMLLTAPGAQSYISGVILYDETIRQSTKDGVKFTKYLEDAGIYPGIKVDTGAKELAGFAGEKVTEGLDGLRERLAEYHQMGARFAKWRAVIEIGDGTPSDFAIHANAHALARYAILCQEGGLVPIVEPEVLMDGAHTIEQCDQVTSRTLSAVFAELAAHRVALDGMLLKPNMVISGQKCPAQAGVEEVAKATLRCLSEQVPAAVPGIVFLSGGQRAELATEHLNAMNAMSNTTGEYPWQLSFSYGRALQAPSLSTWNGHLDRYVAGQQAFLKRAKLNGLARSNAYTREMETEAA